jgi:glycogen debranching enzyme
VCELQGYVYTAWMRMAEVCDHLNKPERAKALRSKAVELFHKFNDAFWDEEAGFYAFALDGAKKKVMSVASNPGHCLRSGIVPAKRAKLVVSRLMQPDIRSGWGIRTLSSEHKSFNPYSYQNGSVWPHDNALLALGLRRYGFDREAAIVMREVCGAGGYFDRHRMPELYGGVQRTPTNFPVQYLGANVPQAWAAGAIFLFVRTTLGFQADAPSNRLYLDPSLPDWLPDLTLKDLRVGERSFDLRFWREGHKSRWEVVGGDPARVLERPFAVAEKLWGHSAAPSREPSEVS